MVLFGATICARQLKPSQNLQIAEVCRRERRGSTSLLLS